MKKQWEKKCVFLCVSAPLVCRYKHGRIHALTSNLAIRRGLAHLILAVPSQPYLRITLHWQSLLLYKSMSVVDILSVILVRDSRRYTQFSTIDNLSCFDTQTPPTLFTLTVRTDSQWQCCWLDYQPALPLTCGTHKEVKVLSQDFTN